jgi:hypothetical protein
MLFPKPMGNTAIESLYSSVAPLSEGKMVMNE